MSGYAELAINVLINVLLILTEIRILLPNGKCKTKRFIALIIFHSHRHTFHIKQHECNNKSPQWTTARH
jgi:hypothetical protein